METPATQCRGLYAASASPQSQGEQSLGSSFRASPFLFLEQDVSLLWKSLPYGDIRKLLFSTDDFLPILPSYEMNFSRLGNVISMVRQLVLLAASVVAFGGVLVCFFTPVPLASVALWIAGWYAFFWVDKWVDEGGLKFWETGREKGVVYTTERETLERKHPNEIWIFINRIATDRHWAQANVDMFSTIFQRAVIGIHNKTNGIFFDLIECMLQREWLYGTQDAVPLLYKKVAAALEDPQITKVVVIGHSQEGIILTHVVDWLIADTSKTKTLRDKLGCYTFATAATHFNSPLNSHGKRILPVVEHFVNKNDYVAQIGVLAWRTTDGDECGAGEDYERLYGEPSAIFLISTTSNL